VPCPECSRVSVILVEIADLFLRSFQPYRTTYLSHGGSSCELVNLLNQLSSKE
jgi:hypothetical protein